jgi:hypothetical protein
MTIAKALGPLHGGLSRAYTAAFVARAKHRVLVNDLDAALTDIDEALRRGPSWLPPKVAFSPSRGMWAPCPQARQKR